MELYTYQKADAARIAGTDKVLLASDTGTGKTATLIRAAEHEALRVWTEHAARALIVVVCPAVVRGVWAQEWKRWGKLKWDITRINSGADIAKIGAINPDRHNVVIVSYDQFSRMDGPKKAQVCPVREALAKTFHPHVTIIADEAHYLKGWGSNRTTQVYGAAKALKAKVWLATATPAPNHYGELYPMFAELWPDQLAQRKLSTKEAFEDHFCNVKTIFLNGREVRTISGSKNPADLKSLLSSHMIRRKKSDVLSELPPMVFDTVPLETPTKLSQTSEFADVPDDDLLDTLNSIGTHIATLRKDVGMAKVRGAVEWVQEFLEPSDKKIVVFAYHTEVIDALMESLADFHPVKIDGRSSAKDRDAAVESFQNGTSRVFVGQIVAAGTGITLTAASDVLFVEFDWVPSNMYQAASRCHRIGQKDNVIVRHAVLEGSLDERIAQALIRKERELSEIFG